MSAAPAILFVSKTDDPLAWRTAIEKRLKGIEFRVWPDIGDPGAIIAAMVWRYPPGLLRQFPNLKLVCSLGAGVDHIMGDPDLPQGVKLVRVVDPDLTNEMSEYVLMAVLRYHRHLPEYERLQREGRWRRLAQTHTKGRRIGILGLGVLGRDAGAKLASLGFPVAGWTRRARAVPDIPNIELFAGAAELPAFLSQTQILVCLLPLTPATAGIVNARTLARLPAGAFVINAARGGHVVDADLIAALDAGHIAGATLDVFTPEPLPADHPYWRHARVTITPHVASLTNPDTAAGQIAENIRRHLAGEQLLNLVDLGAGY